MLNIITDSTADLGPELASRHSISIVPLSVHIGGKSYLDGVDLSSRQLFNLVEKHGSLPTTAAPSIGEYCKMFDRPGESIYIGISSQLSASISNAHLAAQEFPQGKVRIIDSRSVCVGTGILALHAAELRDDGLAAEEVAAQLEAHIPKVRIVFVVDTLEYLHKGGRCSSVQAVLGSLLKIHPAIEARPDGTLGIREKIRGSRKKVLKYLLENLEESLEVLDRRRVFVAHSGCPEEAEYLRSQVQQIAAPQDIHVVEAGCVISSHCGPGTICLLFSVQ
jgi:DegV family protein with EDD domain